MNSRSWIASPIRELGGREVSSIEPQGLQGLVRDIRVIAEATGDGAKPIYDDGALSASKRLRRVRHDDLGLDDTELVAVS
jgi:hypothetical protein